MSRQHINSITSSADVAFQMLSHELIGRLIACSCTRLSHPGTSCKGIDISRRARPRFYRQFIEYFASGGIQSLDCPDHGCIILLLVVAAVSADDGSIEAVK